MAINNLTAENVRQFEENVGYMDSVDEYGNNIDFYQKLATRSAIYPGQGTPLGLAYVALKMNGEAGEFAEHVGKAMRDDNYGPDAKRNGRQSSSGYKEWVEYSAGADLTPDRRDLLIKEIGDVLWYLSAACNELGISLSDAAVTNLRKLADRSERGKLQGSGDER
jgi:NTP pyrophosphatase (non-canonical NTP hydrolase)